MQWRFIPEEYSPELIYIQGSKNIAPDALSRLDIVDTPNLIKNNMKSINEQYELEDEDISCPSNYKTFVEYQQNNKELINIAQNNKDYSIQNFHRVRTKCLSTFLLEKFT